MAEQPPLEFNKVHKLEPDEMIVFNHWPVPPSENKIYDTVPDRKTKRTRLIKSKFLIDYQQECNFWTLKNQDLCRTAYAYLRDEEAMRVVVYVGLHENHIYTKNGKLRKMDVSNRGKALFDCLAKAIHIDDNAFKSVTLETVVVDLRLQEFCRIEMTPHTIRDMINLN